MLRYNSTLRQVPRAARAYGPAVASRWWSPSRRFVILTTGRTGSELLVSLLDSHPDICCESEVLGRLPSFPHRYVAARAAVASYRGFDTFGWKLALMQMSSYDRPARESRGLRDQDVRPAHLHELGFRLILSARRNHVKQALSGWVALRYGHHVRAGDRAAFSPIAVDPEMLVADTRGIEASTAKLDELLGSVPHLRITYEDDLLEPDRHQPTVDRICDYLGIASARVNTDLIKVAPAALQGSISNHDEVRRALTMTGYAQYLDDDDQLL